MRQLVSKMSGESLFTDRMAFEAGVDFIPPPDYATIAIASGAWGHRVTEPGDVIPSLQQALEQLRQGIPAVLDVRIERE
jgi:acetolactate synthase I/II/III large subunit